MKFRITCNLVVKTTEARTKALVQTSYQVPFASTANRRFELNQVDIGFLYDTVTQTIKNTVDGSEKKI